MAAYENEEYLIELMIENGVLDQSELEGAGHKKKGQQSMLEYLMVMVMSMGIIVMLGLFYVTYKEYGGRMMELVSSEYP